MSNKVVKKYFPHLTCGFHYEHPGCGESSQTLGDIFEEFVKEPVKPSLVQKIIEFRVTNGLGYPDILLKSLNGVYERFHLPKLPVETIEDLQVYLGAMDCKCGKENPRDVIDYQTSLYLQKLREAFTDN